VLRRHIAEALVYRRTTVGPQEAGAAPVAAETTPAW